MSYRATEYGFLFVLLTFAAFVMVEVISGVRLHPVQYALAGAALAVFFLLLIALSEHIRFGSAYIAAAGACVALLTWYLRHPLRSRHAPRPSARFLRALWRALRPAALRGPFAAAWRAAGVRHARRGDDPHPQARLGCAVAPPRAGRAECAERSVKTLYFALAALVLAALSCAVLGIVEFNIRWPLNARTRIPDPDQMTLLDHVSVWRVHLWRYVLDPARYVVNALPALAILLFHRWPGMQVALVVLVLILFGSDVHQVTSLDGGRHGRCFACDLSLFYHALAGVVAILAALVCPVPLSRLVSYAVDVPPAMIAALKWTTSIWLGVLAACAACWLMFFHGVLLPVAWVLGSLLLPIIMAPLFVVIMLTPGTASNWVFITVAAIALYLWLLGLACLGFIMKAWNEQRGLSVGPRRPSSALY